MDRQIKLIAIFVVGGLLIAACGGERRPRVEFRSHEDGAVVEAGQEVAIEVGAVGGGQIETVDFYVDEELVSTQENPHSSVAMRAEFTWAPPETGNYTLKVIATNEDGVASSSATITVTAE